MATTRLPGTLEGKSTRQDLSASPGLELCVLARRILKTLLQIAPV